MTIPCEMCGRQSGRLRRVTRSFGRGKETLLIEGVPMVSCASCGESYMTAATLKEIERIRRHRKELAVRREVLVAPFGATA